MKQYVKMGLYGEPGVGKSTFAAKSPNPLFICSDGNFSWLGLPEKNHVEVDSWTKTKAIFAKLNTPEYAWVETVVLDLTEDLFKWCEYDYCKQKKIDSVGDLGYGKGYNETRNEFFIEICKVISLPKHVLFLMHGEVIIEKDRRGVEHTKYKPSSRMPDKLLDQIEGRLRYLLRCYVKAEEQENGKLKKKRYLSIVPKENEFGIARGLDEENTPEDIALDWETFTTVIGLDNEPTPAPVVTPTPVAKPAVKPVVTPVAPKVETPVVEETPATEETQVVEETAAVEEPKVVAKPTVIEQPINPNNSIEALKAQLVKNNPAAPLRPAASQAQEQTLATPATPATPAAPQTQAQKMADIQAKLAALKAQKK